MTKSASQSATFRYTALRLDGSVVDGSIVATSEQLASESLFRSGLYVSAISRAGSGLNRRSDASVDDHAIALRTFADLLDAGLPPLRALQLLKETAPSSWGSKLEGVCLSVEQGSSVTAALRESVLRLPAIVDGLLQAGEAGMGLAIAVRQAADLVGRRAALRRSLIAALAYPAILLVTGAASVALLVMIVLPKFAVILTGLGTKLPLSTRLILGIGGALRSVGPTAALAAVAFVILFHAWRSTDDGARVCGDITLRVPFVGRIVHSFAASQAIHTMGSLLTSGVAMPAALEYASSAAGNRAVEQRLLVCRDAVRNGESLSAALLRTHAVPTLIVRLTRAGEETGRLADMLTHGARLVQLSAEQRLATAVQLIEPTLILTFGAAIALVASALFQAMYAVRPGL